MPDYSHLAWPFFDDRHRALAVRLASFEAKSAHRDIDATCQDYARRLGAAGLLSLTVDHPLDVRSLCLAREILARKSGLADFSFVMQGLGTGPIGLFGSEEIKERYLPAVGRGERIAALAMSEANAGSDVGAIATTAERQGESYVLNGSKTWISNAGIAHHYVVIVRTGEGPGTKGLSAIVVDADTPGFRVSDRIEVIAPHPLGTLEFKDCRVPAANLLGRPGDGFKIAMANLDIFRSTVGAAALGLARAAIDAALGRVRERRLFGRALADYQLTQAKLADMATEIDAATLLVYRAAWTKDQGAARVTREASMAKMFATEAAQRIIDQAVQLFGGLGVTVGQKVEELYREIRALRIYEGTTEVNKLVIAGQLLRTAGPAAD